MASSAAARPDENSVTAAALLQPRRNRYYIAAAGAEKGAGDPAAVNRKTLAQSASEGATMDDRCEAAPRSHFALVSARGP